MRQFPFPVVIGHRGAKESAPENTLASLHQAADEGVGMVEIDVRLTIDGVPIVLHDDTLERTTNGQGAVDALPASALSGLDAGGWFDKRYAGEPVPTFAQALAVVLDRGLGLDLELKTSARRARQTAEAALAVAGRQWPADRPPPVVTSFEPEALAAAAALRPDWPRGLLFGALPPDWEGGAAQVGAVAIGLDHRRLGPDDLNRIARRGLLPFVYTVNDPDRAVALIDGGAAAVVTDRPGAMRTALAGVRPRLGLSGR